MMYLRYFVWVFFMLFTGSMLTWGAGSTDGHTKEQQQGLCQASGRCSVSPATQIEPSVAAVVLPIHGGTPQHSADAARGLSPILAAFCSSMIVVTSDGSLYRPSAVPLPLGESAAGTAAAEPAPTVLQHSIAWAGDAAAALNAAADAAHSSGATWMFVVRAGDQVILQDAAAVLRELQASCKSEQLLACHKTASDPEAQACFFKLPLSGRFEGPTEPIFIPNPKPTTATCAAEDEGNSDGGGCASNSDEDEQMDDRPDCPAGKEPDRITISGIFHEPAVLDYEQRISQVHALRKYLTGSPANRAWWLLQLAEAFDGVDKWEHAEQHYAMTYEASTSRRLAAWAMYRLAELQLREGKYHDAIDSATKGMARHVVPDLLWIASLAAYRAADFRGAVSWAEMAAQVSCAENKCLVDRPAAFMDVDAWYEKPYDVLRFAYRQWGDRDAAAKEAQDYWEGAIALREQQVAGNSSSRIVQLGLQALPLLALPEDVFTPPAPAAKPRVACSITTAHRPDLFRRTWHSFRSRCLDCDSLVEKWYAVDDGSSPEALALMQQAAPPCAVAWLEKKPKQEGHVGSLNLILDEVHGQGFEYLLHLEDDWHFFVEDEYISKALRVMQHDPTISQVLFNQDYADTDADWESQQVASSEPGMTPDGLQYVVHAFAGPIGSAEHAEYVAQHSGGKLNNFHWPGFSLRPGLWRLSAVQQIGNFVAGPRFEEAFGAQMHAAGFRTAFFRGVSCVHLAPTATWLQERVQDMNAVYARHGIKLQHSPRHQHSAHDADLSWR